MKTLQTRCNTLTSHPARTESRTFSFYSPKPVNPAGMDGSPWFVYATITNHVGLRPLLPAKHGPTWARVLHWVTPIANNWKENRENKKW